jgi:hypothetical protein
MTALDLAREHMARTGLDGYTLGVLMECQPSCWTTVFCATCGRKKNRLGRDEGLYGQSNCDQDCAGYMDAPKPPHLFGPTDDCREYTDLLYYLHSRQRACAWCGADITAEGAAQPVDDDDLEAADGEWECADEAACKARLSEMADMVLWRPVVWADGRRTQDVTVKGGLL